MAAKDREAFMMGINSYVPGMSYAAKMIHGQPTAFTLGTPAAPSATAYDTDIDADGAVGLITAQGFTVDARYGRTLTMSMDADPGAAGGVYDVYGFDYLFQPMVERFTHVNGSTAVIYGKKAFKYIDYVKNVTAATNATTVNLGSGYRLGLPYKGDVAWAKEGGILVPLFKRDFSLPYYFSDADATSGISAFLRSPCPGYVNTLIGIPNGGGSTNDPVITVELGGTAITGLTVTVDTSDAAGLLATDTPTTPGYSANNRLRKNSMIELVSAAAASAGSISAEVVITPTQFSLPVLTDPQTVTLGDPRGTYESLADMDGLTEIIVGLVGDSAVNSSGNGGLHGIRHVVA